MPTTLPLSSGQELVVPTRWADVTLAQFVARHAPEPDDTRRPAEVWCNLPAGALDDLAAGDVQYLANLLTFTLDTADVLELQAPAGLLSISSLPYGLVLEAQDHIRANPDRPWLAYAPYLLALCRVHMTYGNYSKGKVAECLEALLAAPVTENYAEAAFFLNSFKNYLLGTPPTQTTKSSRKMRRLMQAASGLTKGSGRFSAWIRRLVGTS
jgi:hypothetical protein